MKLERFRDIVTQIECNPESWCQEIYHSSCGTAHCIAGWAEVHAGLSGIHKHPESDEDPFDTTVRIAKKWLSLNGSQSRWLFDGYRDMEDFYAVLGVGSCPMADGYTITYPEGWRVL